MSSSYFAPAPRSFPSSWEHATVCQLPLCHSWGRVLALLFAENSTRRWLYTLDRNATMDNENLQRILATKLSRWPLLDNYGQCEFGKGPPAHDFQAAYPITLVMAGLSKLDPVTPVPRYTSAQGLITQKAVKCTFCRLHLTFLPTIQSTLK